jgi:hypothetical protein
MEETPRGNVIGGPEAGTTGEKPKRKFHPALLAVFGIAVCAVLGVGSFFAFGTLSGNKAAAIPSIESPAPAPAQDEAAGVPAPTVTNGSGEIVVDDGMSVDVEVYEGEIPQGGDTVK